jgi:hypothetical protein
VPLPPETALFSDIILHNRSFADKEALTSLTFNVPITNLYAFFSQFDVNN